MKILILCQDLVIYQNLVKGLVFLVFLFYNLRGDNMRVLSIKEPFATLIKDGVKRIETRSWKTNYRGELYIHASLTKKDITDRHELLELVKDKTFSYGYIICRCKLKDCVYMTKDFVEDIRNNHHQEYICGIYTEGRYAWVLDEIEILDKPIPAKGKLGIWKYDEYFFDNPNILC